MLKQTIVNIHIPKTAGSTFQKQLGTVFHSVRGSRNHLLLALERDAPAELGYFERLRHQFAEKLKLIGEDNRQLISGHYRFRDIKDLVEPRGEQLSLITFLRDPAARMISDYYYSISERHPTHAEFRATFPEFETYALFEGEQLKQLKYLRPYQGASVEETIKAVRDNFDFVGFTETFDEDFAHLLDVLGCKPFQGARINESPDKDATAAANEKYRDLLMQVLHEEYVLYEALWSHRKSVEEQKRHGT